MDMMRSGARALVAGLLAVSLVGCGSGDPASTTETSPTVAPGTGYLTEPPKNAEEAVSDVNDKTQESQDAVDELEGE